MTNLRPWTLVLSEYLDLPFVLRKTGESVIAARSAAEALECLRHWCPSRIIIDMNCYAAEDVLAYAHRHCDCSIIERHEQVIRNLLAS